MLEDREHCYLQAAVKGRVHLFTMYTLFASKRDSRLNINTLMQ